MCSSYMIEFTKYFFIYQFLVVDLNVTLFSNLIYVMNEHKNSIYVFL